MNQFEFIKGQYLKLRASTIRLLENFHGDSYYYQPTKVSNSTAWIVPHISAFEKIMVADKIDGYKFPRFISEDDVAKYKPMVDGYAFDRDEMMGVAKAVDLLEKTRDISVAFLEIMIDDPPKNIDAKNAAEKYLLNISHETEHLGQLKYLLGTWKRNL
ncbi:MAG: DinB family protein [Candidatus Thorarchaeota archaeon]